MRQTDESNCVCTVSQRRGASRQAQARRRGQEEISQGCDDRRVWQAQEVSSRIPTPSDAVVAKLAGIAVNAENLLASDQPSGKAPVGLQTMKDNRRRSGEKILVLLADPEVRKYLAEVRAAESA
jgi:hypothetical protein